MNFLYFRRGFRSYFIKYFTLRITEDILGFKDLSLILSCNFKFSNFQVFKFCIVSWYLKPKKKQTMGSKKGALMSVWTKIIGISNLQHYLEGLFWRFIVCLWGTTFAWENQKSCMISILMLAFLWFI